MPQEPNTQAENWPLNTLDDTIKVMRALLSRELKVTALKEEHPEFLKTGSHDKIFMPEDKRAPIFMLGDEEENKGKEHFWTIGLNDEFKVCFIDLVATGSKLKVNVKPRMAFRGFNFYKANKAIFVHNHVNADPPEFSEGDKKAMVLFMRAGNLIEVEVLDHLVLNNNYEAASMLNLQMTTSLMDRAIFADKEVEDAAKEVAKYAEVAEKAVKVVTQQTEIILQKDEENSQIKEVVSALTEENRKQAEEINRLKEQLAKVKN